MGGVRGDGNWRVFNFLAYSIIQKEEIETNIFKENLKGNKGKTKKYREKGKGKEIFSKEFRILNNKAKACGNGTAYDEKQRKNRKIRLKSFGFENILLKLSKWKSQIGSATQKKIKLPIDN